MAIVMEAVYDTLQPTTGYDLMSEFRYGSNGYAWGTPEIDTGAPDDLISGRTTWDSNLSDGFDTGYVQVSLIVRAGESTVMQWTVGDQVLTYLGPTYSNISALEITAATNTRASVAWSDMQFSFMSEGNEVDSLSVVNGPKVDQTGLSSPQFKESVMTVLPQNSNVDEVRLTATIRMTAARGVHISLNAIFGQVLIKAA